MHNLTDIERSLGRIEGHLEHHRSTLQDLRGHITHMDKRLGKLEKFNSMWNGAVTVVLSCGNLIALLVSWYFGMQGR